MQILPALAVAMLISTPVFDEAATRGAPFKIEHSLIPEDYLGEWATSRAQCGKASPTNPNVIIDRTRINAVPVKAIWAYSDYPAISVSMGTGTEHFWVLHLDISHDGMWLKAKEDRGSTEKIMRRCPNISSKTDNDRMARKAMASACKARDRDGFIDGFFGSKIPQRKALKKQIEISRGDTKKTQTGRDYYHLPPIKFADHVVYYEYGPEIGVPLQLNVVDSGDGGFRIDWEEEPHSIENSLYENEPDWRHPEGLRGRLSFEWSGTCWALVSDEMRWSDWP
jgi:hypothetical protein